MNGERLTDVRGLPGERSAATWKRPRENLKHLERKFKNDFIPLKNFDLGVRGVAYIM